MDNSCSCISQPESTAVPARVAHQDCNCAGGLITLAVLTLAIVGMMSYNKRMEVLRNRRHEQAREKERLRYPVLSVVDEYKQIGMPVTVSEPILHAITASTDIAIASVDGTAILTERVNAHEQRAVVPIERVQPQSFQEQVAYRMSQMEHGA